MKSSNGRVLRPSFCASSFSGVAVGTAILWLAVLAASAPAQSILLPGLEQRELAVLTDRTRAWGLGVADFDGDGVVDGDDNLYLIAADRASYLYLHENDGATRPL